MNLARLNNFSSDTLRRIIIGLGFGLFGAVLLSFLLNQISDKNLTLELDSELIAITKSQPEKDTDIKTMPKSVKSDVIAPESEQINADGFKFFSINKAPLTNEQIQSVTLGTPRLSIVLSGVGQNLSMMSLIKEKLPKNITLSLSPYSKNQNLVAAELNQYGFEVWQDIIALTKTINSDKGSLAISPTNDFNTNSSLLDIQTLDKHFITGLILPNNALITQTPGLWESLTQDLFSQGYGVLDNTETLVKPALYFFNEKRAPYIKGDITIDDTMTITQIDEAFKTIINTVKNETTLIVTIKSPTPSTLDKLMQWLESLDNTITIVPLSAHAKL